MSRAPVKPRAQKAAAVIAVVPKRTPSKRAPKRAVAVETGVADAAPVKPRKPKDSREKMLASQHALHRSLGMTTHDEIADAMDYAAENAKNWREAQATAIYAFVVFGFIALVGIAVYLWGWK